MKTPFPQAMNSSFENVPSGTHKTTKIRATKRSPWYSSRTVLPFLARAGRSWNGRFPGQLCNIQWHTRRKPWVSQENDMSFGRQHLSYSAQFDPRKGHNHCDSLTLHPAVITIHARNTGDNQRANFLPRSSFLGSFLPFPKYVFKAQANCSRNAPCKNLS